LGGFRVAVAGADLVVIAAALTAAYMLRFGVSTRVLPTRALGSRLPVPYLDAMIVVALIWELWIAERGGYSRAGTTHGASALRMVVQSAMAACSTIAVLGFLTQSELSRGFLALFFTIGIPGLLLSRSGASAILRRRRMRGRHCSRALVVGRHSHVRELVEVLRRKPGSGMQPVAACVTDPECLGGATSILGVPVLGSATVVRQAVHAADADQVLMVEGTDGFAGFKQLAWQLDGTGAELVVVPTVTEVSLNRVRMRPCAELPLLQVRLARSTGPMLLVKRALDVVGASLLILLLSPLLLLIAAMIKVSSPGPVLYRQARVGRHGSQFMCLKFRTMVADADAALGLLLDRNQGSEVLFKLHDDPRVTRIGRHLRRYSLDELPQLFNVLAGQMSLVGPRPSLPDEVLRYADAMRRRMLVRPGMTGLWQVSGRSDLSAAESQRLDLYYVDNWSITADVMILWQTLHAVVSGKGAY
jgi:exopolysaccharide biosynthesis polyprenyl glycosylphosphotransferase